VGGGGGGGWLRLRRDRRLHARPRPVVDMMPSTSPARPRPIINHAAKIYGMFGGQASARLVIRTPGGAAAARRDPLARTSSCSTPSSPHEGRGPRPPGRCQGAALAAIRDDDPSSSWRTRALHHQWRLPGLRRPRPEIRPRQGNPPGQGPDADRVSRWRTSRPSSRRRSPIPTASTSRVVDLRIRAARPLHARRVVRKTHGRVVLEDDWLTYGIGADVAASISDGAFDYLDAPVRRVAMAEVPMPTEAARGGGAAVAR